MDSLNSAINGIHLPNNRYRNDTQVLKLFSFMIITSTRNKFTTWGNFRKIATFFNFEAVK